MSDYFKTPAIVVINHKINRLFHETPVLGSILFEK